MARRKKGDEPEPDGSVAVADPPAGSPETPPPDPPAAEAPPARNRPAASFAAFSDRTTRVEVACWARQVKVSETEEYTQYGLTVSRSWRDREGVWSPNTSYRTHDVPVLLFLVEQAYHWCLAQRTQVRVDAPGDVPF